MATRALCLRYMGQEEPPSKEIEVGGVKYQVHVPSTYEFLRQALTKAGLSEVEVERMLRIYEVSREGLYGRCFLAGKYDAEVHGRIIEEDIPYYLRTISRLIGAHET